MTGKLEPAMSGTFRLLAWSTICCASARLYERCLSMKTGTAAPDDFEDFEHFAKEPPARIELLELFVVGILAMLGDQEDGIDGQLAGSQGESIGNRSGSGGCRAAWPWLGPGRSLPGFAR